MPGSWHRQGWHHPINGGSKNPCSVYARRRAGPAWPKHPQSWLSLCLGPEAGQPPEAQKTARHRLACCAPQGWYAAAQERPGCSRELQPWEYWEVEAAFILPAPPPPQFGCATVLMRVGPQGDWRVGRAGTATAAEAPAAAPAVPRELVAPCPQPEPGEVMLGYIVKDCTQTHGMVGVGTDL